MSHFEHFSILYLTCLFHWSLQAHSSFEEGAGSMKGLPITYYLPGLEVK